MKLYTDKYNPFTLRVLVADRLAGTAVGVQHVQKDEAVKRFPFLKEPKLPFLEVEHNRHIFSPNAICRYLLSCDASKKFTSDLNNLSIGDHWLEWDVLHLQPSVFSFLVASFSPGSSGEANLVTECLAYLESALKPGAKYIVGDELSLTDVVVWGTLYPLLVQQSHQKGLDLNAKYSKVMAWFNNLMQKDEFSSISQIITEGKGPESFKDALVAYQLVNPVASTRKDSNKSEAIADNAESDEISYKKSQVNEQEVNDSVTAWNTQKVPKRRVLEHPILPKDGEKNILITSALPYVNNVPHLGNIIGCVLSADVFAR
ncbi:Methionine--tRNA ligase, cytoplasmic [Paramuricea clavata]|nr:Methionine--tRNA ligase, cytoplasmic [Paramuricea clavata]